MQYFFCILHIFTTQVISEKQKVVYYLFKQKQYVKNKKKSKQNGLEAYAMQNFPVNFEL